MYQLTRKSDTQGIETAIFDEGVATANTDDEDEVKADIVLESDFLSGTTGAVLSSLLTAGRAVPVFGEVFPNDSSPYTSVYYLCSSIYHMYTCQLRGIIIYMNQLSLINGNVCVCACLHGCVDVHRIQLITCICSRCLACCQKSRSTAKPICL